MQFIIKSLFIKSLKRLKLISALNFYLIREYNSQIVKIPFIFGMGIENFFLKPNWLDAILTAHFREDERETSTFIDIGVNIGQTLLKMRSNTANINYIGFEPNPACSLYVSELIKKNFWKNTLVLNYALSDRNVLLTFEKTSISDSRGSVVSNLRPGLFEIKETVVGLQLDSIYPDLEASLIKIDVEGGELEVLIGMKELISRSKPLIVCEVLDSHSNDVLEFTQKRADLVVKLIYQLDYQIIQLTTSNDTIISYRKIDKIFIVQWTVESSNTNDYIFVHKEKYNTTIKLLNTIITAKQQY